MNPNDQADLLRKLAQPESSKLARSDTPKARPAVTKATSSGSTDTDLIDRLVVLAKRSSQMETMASDHPDFQVRAGARANLAEVRQEIQKLVGSRRVTRKSAGPNVDRLTQLAKASDLVNSEDWQLRGAGRNAERELDTELNRFAAKAASSTGLPDVYKAAIHSAVQRGVADLVERLKQLEQRSAPVPRKRQ